MLEQVVAKDGGERDSPRALDALRIYFACDVIPATANVNQVLG
jgi:hypothetical protein